MKKVKEYTNDYGFRVREELNDEGEPDGLFRWWHTNGRLGFECTYKDGKLNGLYRWWNEAGELKVEKTFKNGVEVSEERKEKNYEKGK